MLTQAIRLLSAACALFLITSCSTAREHAASLKGTQDAEFTLGIVQKEIVVKMSQADVAEKLGSPNIVTRDSNGKETWIYDKIAQEASYSHGSGGLNLILAGVSKNSGAAQSSQKTLTVVIKFDENHLVDSFTYHSSRF